VADRGLKTSMLPITAHGAYWTHADVLTELLAKMK
jgi:hypothetical protein